MKKFSFIDKAETPDGKTIALYERDGTYFIRVDGIELMSTRQHSSEEKLAELACAHIRQKPQARVLIGGLGFGFTLRAALEVLPADAKVLVAELMPAVIDWNRNPKYRLAYYEMEDLRVDITQRDVAEVIAENPGAFDSMLLDVDNGPWAFTTAGNEELYEMSGLLAAKKALRPGGCVGYWSTDDHPAFAKRMVQAGFTVQVRQVHSYKDSGSKHTLFFGRIP